MFPFYSILLCCLFVPYGLGSNHPKPSIEILDLSVKLDPASSPHQISLTSRCSSNILSATLIKGTTEIPFAFRLRYSPDDPTLLCKIFFGTIFRNQVNFTTTIEDVAVRNDTYVDFESFFHRAAPVYTEDVEMFYGNGIRTILTCDKIELCFTLNYNFIRRPRARSILGIESVGSSGTQNYQVPDPTLMHVKAKKKKKKKARRRKSPKVRRRVPLASPPQQF